MKQQTCNVQGCRDEHHARGYCNKHYKKYMRLDDPTAGRFNRHSSRRSKKSEVYMQPYEPERREKITPGTQQPFAFLVNQKLIEKLYKEIVKAQQEPLFRAHNQAAIVPMLRLSAQLAGYDQQNHAFLADLLSELEQWAEHRDHLRYMDALAQWPQRLEQFSDNRTQVQLALPIK